MGRNSYREGMAQVNVVLDPELRDRMRRKARRNGRSMSEEFRLAALMWLGEEVEDDRAGAGPGRGCAAVSDGGGPRPVSGGDRPDHARVGADREPRPLMLLGADEPALPFDEWVSVPVEESA